MPHVTCAKGRYWLVMVSCCLMVGVSLGVFTNAYGVFYTPLAEKLQTGRGAVSLHATITGLVTALSQPMLVRLLNKLQLQWLVLTGIVLMAGTTVLTAWAGAVWQLNVLGVIRGLGIGCCYVPVVTTILGNWFHSHYGTISGMTLSFSGVTGAVMSQLLSRLLSRFGLTATLLMTAAGVAAALLPALLFCRTRPEEIGLLPLGSDSSPHTEPSGNSTPGQTFSVKWLLLPLCMAAFLSSAMTSFTQHLTSYTQILGLSSGIGASMMSAVMVGNILSKLLSGILTDILGAFRSAGFFLLAATFGMAMLSLCPSNHLLLLAAAFLLGFSYSVGTVGASNMTRVVYGSERYGQAFSIVNACGCISASLSISMIGYSYDWAGDYRPATATCVIFGLVGLFSIYCIAQGNKKADL